MPHPSINLVVDAQSTRVFGVPTRRDVRLLHDRGWAVGTKFRPGAFTAITGIAAVSMTDSSIAAPAALASPSMAALLEAAEDPLELARAEIETRLSPYADVDDPALELIAAVIASMHECSPDTRVEQLASRHHLAPRTLQRLFRRCVGVGPKWVLKRLRIHEAVERLTTGPSRTWTELALDLGYYDHAHFIRDFRLVTERSPAEYVHEASAALKHCARGSDSGFRQCETASYGSRMNS